jgi:hypothetical protein
MRLSIRGMAISIGLIWGVVVMFLTGVANLLWPSYGQAFLETMASLYPGYSGPAGFGQVITGTLYGAVDAAIGGALFAWLYNRFA